MTEEQRRLCGELLIHPNGLRLTSKDDFLQQFPSAVAHGRLALRWLDEAFRAQDAKDLQSALMVGFNFGFSPEHADVLCRLIDSNWHHSHEDVVSALEELRIPQTAQALFRATQWIPKYLEFDESRALASKAIWALGKLPGEEAETKLTILASSENAFLRNAAVQQIERRGRPARLT